MLRLFLFLFFSQISVSFAAIPIIYVPTTADITPTAESFSCSEGVHKIGGFQNRTNSLCVNDSALAKYTWCDNGSIPIEEEALVLSCHQGYKIECDSLNSSTGQCNPSCSDIGFIPDSFYPSGFCIDDGGVPSSSPHSQCVGGEMTHNIPLCNLQPCPDGSFIDTNLGQSCAIPKMCWNGSLVYGDTACPPPPFVCPDGSQVQSQASCPDPSQDNKTCDDGSTVPLAGVCPITNTAHCADGSSVSNVADCPDFDMVPTICPDGSQASGSSGCPAVQTAASNQKDTMQSSTIQQNPDGTVTTSNTVSDLDLSGVNSRLDKIDSSVNKGFGDLKDSLFGDNGASVSDKGSFDDTAQQRLIDVKNDFDATFQNIKTQVNDFFGVGNVTGPAGLPIISFGNISVAGSSIPIEFDFSKHATAFNMIGTAISLLSYLLAAMIVLKGYR